MPCPGFFSQTHSRISCRSAVSSPPPRRICPGIPLGGREQAVPDLAVGGDPQPIAVLAKRFADRVDKADPAHAIGEVISRPPAGWGPAAGRAAAAQAVSSSLAKRLAIQDLIGLPTVFGVQRHELDEPQFQAVFAGEARQRHGFVFGDAADRDGVQADPLKATSLGGRDAVQHLLQTLAARDPLESWLRSRRRD